VGCDIVAYHWQYMIYLAWLASITHLASLSFLRNHLANNPAKRAWRLVAMFTIQAMLSVAVGLSMTFTEDTEDPDEGPHLDPWLNRGGRPAQCYFRKGVETNSVTFQSAIKFIVLLVWGLAIRIAKTFEGFEGGLRKTAALLEQRGNRHRRAYSGSTGRDWDHAFAHASLPRRVWSYFSVPIFIGFCSVLSIQLDLFTSLLAEVSCGKSIIPRNLADLFGQVYWLFFTIIWITARLIKLRIPGNQDDSKWTFGQVLPIILLVAPLVLATEAFYTTSASKEPANNHPEIPVPNPDDIRDLSHIHSPAYRGAFFLAVLSYIEIAVYFVLDQPATQGIANPLIVILLSAFLLQPVLQLSWVVCNLWLDNLTWGMPLKRTIRDVVLFMYSAISLAQSLPPGAFMQGLSSDDVATDLYALSVLLAFLLIFYTHASLTATFVLIPVLRATKWRFPLYGVLFCVSYLTLRTVSIGLSLESFASIRLDMFLLISSAVQMPLQLLTFSLEVWAEKKGPSKWIVYSVRSVSLICLSPFCLVLIQFYSYMILNLFFGSFLLSVHIWSVIGLCLDNCKHSFDTALGSAVLAEP
jgi:hypothetical protein